ncbi:MAG: hypothetical protein IPK03_17525 [Bacteroidetes bacterium]|nr:hypothetical protein [Bacteroidota bacterium]
MLRLPPPQHQHLQGPFNGYNATSTTNASIYVQGSSNATNGVNQICLALKWRFIYTQHFYLVKVINAGASGAALGRELMYRDSYLFNDWNSCISGFYAPSTPSS